MHLVFNYWLYSSNHMSLSTYLCRLTYLTTRTHIANAHSASSRARDMEWRTVAVIVLVVSLCFFIVPIKVGPDKTVEDAKLFADYIARYNKTYRNDSTEYKERFDNFQKSLRHIERLNGLRSSQESAYYGLTEFSDLSEDEFLQQTLLPDLSLRGQKHTAASYYHQHSVNSVDRMKRMIGIPSKFDWRDRGVVGPVVNQESCGACWAFSTIGVAESMYAIRNGTLYSFSVQEVGRYIPDTLFCLQAREPLEEVSRGKYKFDGNAFTRHRRINIGHALIDILKQLGSYSSSSLSIFQRNL